jgi:hypothetical protein
MDIQTQEQSYRYPIFSSETKKKMKTLWSEVASPTWTTGKQPALRTIAFFSN